MQVYIIWIHVPHLDLVCKGQMICLSSLNWLIHWAVSLVCKSSLSTRTSSDVQTFAAWSAFDLTAEKFLHNLLTNVRNIHSWADQWPVVIDGQDLWGLSRCLEKLFPTLITKWKADAERVNEDVGCWDLNSSLWCFRGDEACMDSVKVQTLGAMNQMWCACVA